MDTSSRRVFKKAHATKSRSTKGSTLHGIAFDTPEGEEQNILSAPACGMGLEGLRHQLSALFEPMALLYFGFSYAKDDNLRKTIHT